MRTATRQTRRSSDIDNAVSAWQLAKIDLDVAQSDLDRAREGLLAVLPEGEWTTTHGKVTVFKRTNRAFDIETLRRTLNRYRFRKVTKQVIDLDAFDADADRGAIPPAAFQAITWTETTVVKGS